MPASLQRAFDSAKGLLWDVPERPAGRARRAILWFIHLVYKLLLEFRKGQLTIRAASLVYTTILTIVPVLTVAFSVLKSIGVHNKLQPLLLQFLEPLGSRGTELTNTIVSFVDNVKVGVLGSIGLAFLLYTVISSIQQVEGAFNYTWHVTRERTLGRKFRDYLSVILAGPVLLVSAVGITGTAMTLTVTKKLQAIAPLGVLIETAGNLVPYLMVFLSFTLLYYLLPNTRVQFRSALVGGISAGVLWQTGGLAFTSFVVSSVQYPAIYKGFAILLLFVIWLYYSWLILLVGAKISFFHQHPTLLVMRNESALCSQRLRERTALAVMYLIGLHYYHNRPRWTHGKLVRTIQLPLAHLQEILDLLVARDILLQLADDQSYMPTRDLDTITVADIITTMRDVGDPAPHFISRIGAPAEIDNLLERIEVHGLEGTETITIKSLVLAAPAPHAA